MSTYEINAETLAILPINSHCSKVIEKEATFIINKSTFEIIDDSCRFFGSSYRGRHEGTKSILGFSYKAPIVIEESRDLIFFPTRSPRYDDCCWISLKEIETYKRQDYMTIIYFYSGREIKINMSFSSFENQVLRATRLESVLRDRKNR